MSNTAYWILGVVAALVVTGLVVWGLWGGSSTPATQNASDFQGGLSQVNVPVSSGAQPGAGGARTRTLRLQDRTTVVVKDFLNSPETVADSSNPGAYYIGNSIDPASPDAPASPYVISYIESTDFFSIILLQEPVGESRRQAEQYLMQRLGISEHLMCHLRYTMTVPVRVSQIYAGESFGFSFCPGASQL